MRIRTFVMAASTVAAAVLLGGGYYSASRLLDHTVKENASEASSVLAKVAFSSMYQAMSIGWNREQANSIIASISDAAKSTPTTLQIYRAPVVDSEYGEVVQPALDASLRQALSDGKEITESPETGIRYIMPLLAKAECLHCHDNAKEGVVLGAIEVKQDFTPLLERAHKEMLLWMALVAPFLLGLAILVVWRVNRRLEQSIGAVDQAVANISAVADLGNIHFERQNLGFTELNQLFSRLADLVDKLREVAVDKSVLRFEIGLLEKFVITSEVVRDWDDYIARLLVEINQVMTTHVLFSVFHIGDDVFDLDIFWLQRPTEATRLSMERHMRTAVGDDARFAGFDRVLVRHHSPPGGEAELELDEHSLGVHTKSLFVENPKIGGIVGIGVNAVANDDDTLRLVMDSVLSTLLNVVGSVKAIHKFTREMESYATRDPLTDLFNRRMFWELFNAEVGRAKRHEYSFALLVIDLDNFKLVNDGYGHAMGDRYLQEFARIAHLVLRPEDVFARFGGDEFAVILPEVNLEQATAVAKRVLDAAYEMSLEVPGGAQISGSVSIGIGLYPIHADNTNDLFLFADNMMYKAKNAGKHQIGIPSEEEVAQVFRDVTETTVMVVNAVNERRIVPFFQPILDLKSGRVVGFEVLSRLALKEGAHMEASRFIEYAEKAGVIHRLDTMVMETALKELARHGFTGHIFINLSPRALVLSDFLVTLRHTVAESGIKPGQIVFEITERDTIKNIVVLERLVNELKLCGFKLAIDDFGSGFSSFQYLRRFNVDFLKIEGDFVMNLLESDKDRAFVQTIGQLARDLGIKVIAEHVENEAVLNLLREMDVDLGQGYFIGRPNRNLGEGTVYPLC